MTQRDFRFAALRSAARSGLILWLAVGLAGCATLPSSGPTAHDIVRSQAQLANFEIVDADDAVIRRAGMSAVTGRGRLAPLAGLGDVDMIGRGDVLQIAVYEVGAALFGGRSSQGDSFKPVAGTGETLPNVTVGRDGAITVPWVGRMIAAGKTTDQLAAALTASYRRISESPQVMVSIRENVNNTVIVQGDVKRPGRIPLTLARERVLDAIAMTGGAASASVDSLVTLTRGGRSSDQPLSSIDPSSADDVELLPQDRISVAFRPRTFTILGATGRPSEVPFQNLRVSLAEAIGRTGGPNDASADPSAVFVFRYDLATFDGAPIEGAKPIAYRFDMRSPATYFLAQRFEMRPRDVIYIANARANLPTKAIQILNLFFSPFYTAKVLTQ